MYKVDSVFLCQLHAHTLPLRMYWPRLFSKILTMTMFITSQSFISLLSFIFVSAVVSELEPEQEEEEKFLKRSTNHFSPSNCRLSLSCPLHHYCCVWSFPQYRTHLTNIFEILTDIIIIVHYLGHQVKDKLYIIIYRG